MRKEIKEEFFKKYTELKGSIKNFSDYDEHLEIF